MLQLQSAFGIIALLAIAWAIEREPPRGSLRQAAIGLAMTLVTAFILIKLPFVAQRFRRHQRRRRRDRSRHPRRHVLRVRLSRRRRAAVRSQGHPAPTSSSRCRRLPIVLVMSVLTTLLFYWRVLPPIVRGLAWLLERTLGVGGAVGLSTAANIFLGMVESPLFVRPYLAQHDAQRIVPRDDRRHGGHRRHGAGAVCDHARRR